MRLERVFFKGFCLDHLHRRWLRDWSWANSRTCSDSSNEEGAERKVCLCEGRTNGASNEGVSEFEGTDFQISSPGMWRRCNCESVPTFLINLVPPSSGGQSFFRRENLKSDQLCYIYNCMEDCYVKYLL